MELFKSKVCSYCKGRKQICGRPKCPILERFRIVKNTKSILNKKEIFGASPPSIFVGEFGYPKVRIGPMVPPVEGDTSHLDNPLKWENATIENVLEYRSMLVMGQATANVNVNKNSSFLSDIQELSMAIKPVDSVITLKHKPSLNVVPSEFAPPLGPRGELLKFKISENPKIPTKSEYIVNDDLKASEAVISLYNSGFDEYYIIKLLSAGLLGLNKKLVPTRWSITAIQDMLGKNLKKEVLGRPYINNYELYFYEFLGNRYTVLLMPDQYSFELLEVWLNGSLFGSKNPRVLGDFEDIKGIKDYAKETTGAFYASRLSVLEYLRKRKRQSKVLIFREVTPKYYAPVGVWQIRTGVKKALENPIGKFDNLNDALNNVKKFLRAPLEGYTSKSRILKNRKMQVILDAYLN